MRKTNWGTGLMAHLVDKFRKRMAQLINLLIQLCFRAAPGEASEFSKYRVNSGLTLGKYSGNNGKYKGNSGRRRQKQRTSKRNTGEIQWL